MTKEELKQEAEDFVCSKQSFWKQGRTCVESVRQAYFAGAEPREKRIAELEVTNKTISNECHKLVDSLEKKQKEVAELKKESDFYHREKGEYKSAFLQEVRKTIKLNKQLTKAKEIIKQLVNGIRVLNDPKVELTDCDGFLAEAEQFLKDSEVEK